jgi:Domain of unknown function (DUF4123)
MTSQWLSRIEECFWPQGFRRNIWMIVDAARDRLIFPMLQEFHLEYYCLYSGTLPTALEAAAPYLLQLDYNDQDMRRFLRNAWGNSWGVFLRCDTHANALRRHLRGFLLVQDSSGNRLVFRYYDPRVLRVYLPTCTQDELRTVFGPIERFWVEDVTPGIIVAYSFDQNRLVEGKLSLDRGELDSSDLS